MSGISSDWSQGVGPVRFTEEEQCYIGDASQGGAEHWQSSRACRKGDRQQQQTGINGSSRGSRGDAVEKRRLLTYSYIAGHQREVSEAEVVSVEWKQTC